MTNLTLYGLILIAPQEEPCDHLIQLQKLQIELLLDNNNYAYDKFDWLSYCEEDI